MRTYAWIAITVVVAATTACSTSTRARFAATAAEVARAGEALPPPPPIPPARVIASPVVAAPRPIALNETGPAPEAGPGSPDALPMPAAHVPLRPVNATCPVMVGMPVDPACTTTWHGCCIAFCDRDALARWQASPEAFASNLPPTLSPNPIAPPVPGAQLVAAPASGANPLVKASARPAPKAAPTPLAPVTVPAHDPAGEHAAPVPGLFGEEDEGECKDGSCRLPLPPR